MVPARVWYYMYAYTDERNYFIYAYMDKVEFFARHETGDITDFQDTIFKLESIKYFNEKEDDCINKLRAIDLVNIVNEQKKIGDCLVSPDLQTNFKGEVWVDTLNSEVTLRLKDAGEFTNKRTSDIRLT